MWISKASCNYKFHSFILLPWHIYFHLSYAYIHIYLFFMLTLFFYSWCDVPPDFINLINVDVDVKFTAITSTRLQITSFIIALIDKWWHFGSRFSLFKRNLEKSTRSTHTLRLLWSFQKFQNFCYHPKVEVAYDHVTCWQILTLM